VALWGCSGGRHVDAQLQPDASAVDGSASSDGAVSDGDGSSRTPPGPILVRQTNTHGCAFQVHGKIICWGDDYFGELGDGTTGGVSSGVGVMQLDDVVDVSPSGANGQAHTCAVTGDGAVWCWGFNYYGQLGDGTTDSRSLPGVVPGISDAIAVATGGEHTCALRKGGTVLCWGNNSGGELGDLTITMRTSPVEAQNATGAVQIAGGFEHNCIRIGDGTVRCWGANVSGEVGSGSVTSAFYATPVVGISDAVEIACGVDHSCARHADGKVSCWGAGGQGQLGNGGTDDQYAPVDVVQLPDSGVAQLASGTALCARGKEGQILCWGYQYNSSGVGMTSLVPIPLPDQTDASADIGGFCSVSSAGTVSCWGNNFNGQLGVPPGPASGVPRTIPAVKF